jgi:hypothetical protein
MLIGNVAQIAINHIGILIVDEIQNVVQNKNGTALISMLTQLINSSGISIAMVGTPECTVFFEQAMQLARRSLGLYYSVAEYDQFFYDFCTTIFRYQYVKNQTNISDSIVRWLYDHSGGIISVVISLIHDSQEIAILNGTETMNLDNLNTAYKKRLAMIHSYIDPPTTKSKATVRKKQNAAISPPPESEPNTDKLISTISATAKEQKADVVSLLQKHILVEVIQL